MEISQAGSSQRKQRLRVTNVMAHGPGIKLLDGLAEASTIGETTYAYRCRLRFCTRRQGLDQMKSSLLLWSWPAGQLWVLLGKGGVAATSIMARSDLCGADGVVCSTSEQICAEVERTTPTA